MTIDSLVMNGEVAFQTAELLLFRSQGVVTVFTPAQLTSARAFDVGQNIHHRWLSLRAPERGWRLYELVVSGPIQVLRVLQSKLPLEREASDKHDYDYFVATANRWVRLHRFYQEVYPELAAADQRLVAWVKSEAAHPHHLGDAIRIVKKYNEHRREERWETQDVVGRLF